MAVIAIINPKIAHSNPPKAAPKPPAISPILSTTFLKSASPETLRAMVMKKKSKKMAKKAITIPTRTFNRVSMGS